MTDDAWTHTPLGTLELRRNGDVRGFVFPNGIWRTTGSGLGREKDIESAKIALTAAVDLADMHAAGK